jgi:hypothetical protein
MIAYICYPSRTNMVKLTSVEGGDVWVIIAHITCMEPKEWGTKVWDAGGNCFNVQEQHTDIVSLCCGGFL